MRKNSRYTPAGDVRRELGGDFGPAPFVVNIEKVTEENPYFRRALWTGKNLQLTLMSIPIGGEIGLEAHPHLDQFLRLEEGCGFVMMGESPDALYFQRHVCSGDAVFIPAGAFHNLINTGASPVQLYSIYAPPEHPHGTIHKTKQEADAAEYD